MDAIFFCGVPVGCVMAYGVVMDATRQNRTVERDRREWREYATRRGFRYSNEGRTFSLRNHHRLEGCVQGVRVSCSTGPGILRMPTTTIRTVSPLLSSGRLYVSCDDVFSRAEDDVLARRVDVNDSAFNGDAFIVQSTEPDLPDLMLVPSVRRVLLAMHASGRQSLNFRCDKDELAVEWLGSELLPDLFELGWSLMVAAFESHRRGAAYR